MSEQQKPISEAERARRVATSERMKARHEAKRQKKDAKIEAAREPMAQSNVTYETGQPEVESIPESAPSREVHPRDELRQGTGRRQRKPLGAPVQRLSARVPEGMTGRWVNDTPGRVQRAQEGDYQFIGDDGEVVQDRAGGRAEIVGTGRDGGAMRAYLMAIPTVLYEQDQAAKQAQIDKVDDAIRRGLPQQANPKDRDAFYTPSEGINLRSEVR